MAAISDADVSINAAGDFRWTGAATTPRHTVLEFIQWMMKLQDDDQAVGDDLLDITVDTPFDRSTDQIVKINFPFNIDDTLASHLYDGSVEQALDTNNALGERWSGLEVLGPVETGTEYMILQAGRIIPAFWGTGINSPGGASLVFSRHLVKSYEGGVQIDGQRITVLARKLGDQFRRFPVTLGTANSVAAIGNGADIFNAKSDVTLAGFTDITNTEGFQELDIDGSGAAGQEYYSQWDKGSRLVNDVYEVTKWISQNAHQADITAGPPTGADFVIENATIVGQAQSFIPLSGTEFLTEVRANVKILAGTPTGTIYAELWDSDDAGTPEPTGGALARSEDILASAITSDYEEIIFRFNRKDPTGAIGAQDAQLDLGNAEYFIVFRHDAGDAGNNFSLEGQSTSSDGTQSQADAAAGDVWSGSLTDDIFCEVKSASSIHGIAGEGFEGISVEVIYDNESGTGVVENEILNWGTLLTINTVVGTFIEGEHIEIKADGGTVVKNGGQLLFTNGTTAMLFAAETLSGLLDNDDITGVDSGATAKIDITILNDDKAGGTGILLAKDDNGAEGDLYLQLVTGVNPVDDSRIYAPGATANFVDANITINTRTLSPEYLGTSTGSNIIGTYGIGFDPNDVGASDRFLDLSDTPRTPPNNVIFTVSGLVSGEDRVLVGPRTGSVLNKAQLQTDTNLSAATETLIQCSAAIPAGTPSSGTGAGNTRVRVELDTGIYRRVQYDSFSGNDFTITVGPDDDWTGINVSTQPKDVFVAYIDVLADAATETFTAVHTIDVDLIVRVRDGGTAGDNIPIKTFEATAAQFLSTPVTVAAVRTTDA